jgi:hypothetical protein
LIEDERDDDLDSGELGERLMSLEFWRDENVEHELWRGAGSAPAEVWNEDRLTNP